MINAAPPADFLYDFQQHWPFPTPLAGCTLVSTRFNQHALSPELFTHYAITAPQAASKRQAEFLAARLCAREALRLQTGHTDLPTAQEKSRIPCWPAHSCGSMSHSHNISAAIVGANHCWQGFGLDIEKPIPSQRAQRLAQTILTPAEYSTYQGLNTNQQAMYLTLAFSFKESLFKALNPLTGIYFSFHDAQVLDLEVTQTGHARLRLCKNLSTIWQAGCELEGQFARLHDSALTLVAVAS